MSTSKGKTSDWRPLPSNPRGEDLAQFLAREATLDSTRLKEIIEDAALSDLDAYFQARNLNFDIKELKVILGAVLPGGNFTFKNLPVRLERVLPRTSKSSIEETSTELYLMLQGKRSDLNYFRYTLNAVSKVLGDIVKIFDERIIMGLQPADESRIIKKLSILMSEEVTVPDEVTLWINDLCNLYIEISELIQKSGTVDLFDQNKSSGAYEKVIKSKVDISSVSTKSISTYVLRLREYVSYRANNLGTKDQKKTFQLDFQQRILNYKDYISPSEEALNKNWKNAKNYEQVLELFQKTNTSSAINSKSKIVTIKERLLSKGIASISFSGLGIEESLIPPVLRSLKSQLKIMPNQKIFVSEAETETDYLSVSVEGLKEKDLESLRLILDSHAS